MDRLTRTGQDFENELCSGCDCVYYGEPNGCNHPDGNCGSYTYFTLVADRLAEYEDSNLTPAEVAKLAIIVLKQQLLFEQLMQRVDKLDMAIVSLQNKGIIP